MLNVNFTSLKKNESDSFSIYDLPSSVWIYHQSYGKMMATVSQGISHSDILIQQYLTFRHNYMERKERIFLISFKIEKTSCKISYWTPPQTLFARTEGQSHSLITTYKGHSIPF